MGVIVDLTYDELFLASVALRDRATSLNGMEDMERLADKLDAMRHMSTYHQISARDAERIGRALVMSAARHTPIVGLQAAEAWMNDLRDALAGLQSTDVACDSVAKLHDQLQERFSSAKELVEHMRQREGRR